MDSFNRRSSKGASLASVCRLDTGLVQNAPNASLSPELWMLSSCRRLVFDAVPYTMQPQSNLEKTMARYSIRSASLFSSPFQVSDHSDEVESLLALCFQHTDVLLKWESHHSPRNFVDSSTGRSVSPIPTMGGLWARDCGAVKCMTLHLWAANLKPFLVAHSSMALTACCRCLSMVSRERNALLLCLTRFWSWFAVGEIRRWYMIWGRLV